MTTQQSGDTPFKFVHRPDLHVLPDGAREHEVDLHGGFAADQRPGFGQLYYGMPGSGILRVAPDLRKQECIQLPERLRPMNFHSTRIGKIDGDWRLFLPANQDALVAVVSLEGRLDFVLPRPTFEQYQVEDSKFAPTDTILVADRLFVADGYGANYISSADIAGRQWVGIFGGKAEHAEQNGKFSTAHGINHHPAHPHHLMIADRPNSRVQVHGLDGAFIASRRLPSGSWPCGIDFIQRQGRTLGVIGSLVDPVQDRPAPIYVVDVDTFEVLSTIRPKEELGVEPAQHLHNVVWHVYQDQLYLVCQSWNPGHYFVLAQV